MNKASARPTKKTAASSAKPTQKPRQQKSAPQQRTLPDGSPVYLAIGCVNGILNLKASGAILVQPSGDRLQISTIRNQRMLLWLLNHAEQWRDRSVNWVAYPDHRGCFTLVGVGDLMGNRQLEPRQFIIQGGFRQSPEQGKFCIFVGRNDPKQSGYSIFQIEGELPNAADRELWRCECLLNGRSFVLLNGLKLADAPKVKT